MANGVPALMRRIVIGGIAQPPPPVKRLCYGIVGVYDKEVNIFFSHFGLDQAKCEYKLLGR
jgi:hypothetical protein